jgi:predicted  nucleic acid-binding Zn-ribbon protein
MDPQIGHLYALHRHDRRMVALEARLKSIPSRLEEMDRDLAGLQDMLDSEKGKLGATVDFRREQERQLEEEEDQIRNSKTRLGAVKTARELAAAQREIDTTRRMAAARGDEIDKLNAAIGNAEERIAKMQAGLDDLVAAFDGERKKLSDEQAKLQEVIDRDSPERDVLAKQLEIPLLRNYERIRRRAGGIAFVPVRERRCGGCKMQVPHQLYVSLRRGTEIPACESCGRLLYWQGHFPKGASTEEASGSPVGAAT